MIDQLMSLSEIERLSHALTACHAYEHELLIATARAAHEWKERCDEERRISMVMHSTKEVLREENVLLNQENKSLGQQLSTLMIIIDKDNSLETFEDHRCLLVDMRHAYDTMVEVSDSNEQLSHSNKVLTEENANLCKQLYSVRNEERSIINKAIKQTWEILDFYNNSPPGSFLRGQRCGIEVALKTLRENWENGIKSTGESEYQSIPSEKDLVELMIDNTTAPIDECERAAKAIFKLFNC